MADSESKTALSNKDLYQIKWGSSDKEVVNQMNIIIKAIKAGEVEAVTTVPKYDGGCAFAIHMFGMSGTERCRPEVVTTWLSLLVTWASSEGITGQSLAHLFPKCCGGCMVYSILMAVGCFHSTKNIELAFEFFRHVLADPAGEILELDEVNELSSLLVQSTPARQDGTYMRNVCLELHCYERIWNMNNIQKLKLEALRHLIEGLGVLCTSSSFLCKMKENRTATVNMLKESIMTKTFSYNFAKEHW